MAWVAGGQVFAALGTLLGIKLLTSMLSPSSYGEVALAITVSGVINLFLFGPLSQAAMRFYAICSEQGSLSEYGFVVRKFVTRISLILMALSLVAALVLWNLIEGIWASWALLAVIFGVVAGVFSIPITILSAMRERRLVAVLQVLDVWLRVLVAALFVAYVNDSRAAVGGFATSGVLVLAVAAIVLRKRLPTFVGKDSDHGTNDLSDRFISFALPFVWFASFAAISQFGDRWVLQGAIGEAEVGVYAVLQQVATMPLMFLYAVMSSFVAPIVFSKVGSHLGGKRHNEARKLIYVASGVFCAMAAMLGMTAVVFFEPLIGFVSSKDYIGSILAFSMIYGATALFLLAQFIALLALAKNRSHDFILPKGVQAATTLCFGLLLVGRFGIDGVAGAALAGAAVHLVLMWRVCRE